MRELTLKETQVVSGGLGPLAIGAISGGISMVGYSYSQVMSNQPITASGLAGSGVGGFVAGSYGATGVAISAAGKIAQAVHAGAVGILAGTAVTSASSGGGTSSGGGGGGGGGGVKASLELEEEAN